MSSRRDNPELPNLPTFVHAAETSSFTAAAKALSITQAAVSQRMQALERAVGKPLFHRRGGQLTLTDAGRKLYDFAQRIADLHRKARQELSGKELPLEGDLYLAASSVPGEYLLPGLLADFRSHYPHIHAHATVSDSLGVLGQVEHGEASVGLVGLRTDDANLEFRRLGSDRMVLVVGPRHALAKKPAIDVHELKKYPLVVRESGSGLRHGFEKAFADAGLAVSDLNIAFELGSNEAIKEAVRRGMGVAVLSIHAVEREVKARRLRSLEIEGLQTSRDIYLVYDRRRVLPLPARMFVTFLETQAVLVQS